MGDFPAGVGSSEGAAVEFGMALLAAETLGFDDGNTLQADFLECFLHFVELERLDYGFDFFHWGGPLWSWASERNAARVRDSMPCASTSGWSKRVGYQGVDVERRFFRLATRTLIAQNIARVLES